MVLPVAWICRWFLKSTWQNFTDLHSSGTLRGIDTRRPYDRFLAMRFCTYAKRWLRYEYSDGAIVTKSCPDKKFAIHAIRPDNVWPMVPEEAQKKYEAVLAKDELVALDMGCMSPKELRVETNLVRY